MKGVSPIPKPVELFKNWPPTIKEQAELVLEEMTETSKEINPNVSKDASSVSKDTNPKDFVGIKKAPLSTVSGPVLMELGLAMLEGARKYGRFNYREKGVLASVYYDALQRHMIDWYEGEDLDPDSGLSHVTKAIATLCVLRDAMIQGKFKDDRPPKSPPGWLAEFNKKAGSIVDKYPNPVAPITALSFDGKKEETS